MDHRASFVEVLLGKEIDKPNDQQLAHLNEAKDLVYRGLSTAKPQLPFGRPAVLVDELYGSGVIRSAKEEATRLTARQKAAENRVEQVKSMLAFFMRVRGTETARRRIEQSRKRRVVPSFAERGSATRSNVNGLSGRSI